MSKKLVLKSWLIGKGLKNWSKRSNGKEYRYIEKKKREQKNQRLP